METKEPKTETKVTYDDRKKELTQKFVLDQDIQNGEDIVGNAHTERMAVFKEEGIRKVYQDLRNQEMQLQQVIKKIKDDLKEAPEMTEELKQLEEKLKAINDHNKAKQMQSQIEAKEKDLKEVKTNIREIKEAIGTRLKL